MKTTVKDRAKALLDENAPEPVLAMAQVIAIRGGGGTSRLYADMDAGLFPRPIKTGRRAVAWLQREVVAWQNQRIAERDAQARKTAKAAKAGAVA